MALRAILALPLRAMAALFCGRDGSKLPAGSNQSKDWRLSRGAGFGRREHHSQPVRLAVFRVVLAQAPRASHEVLPILRCSHSASNITPR